MKRIYKLIVLMLLTFVMLMVGVACTEVENSTPEVKEEEAVVEEVIEEPIVEVEKPTIRLAAMTGPTGIGAVNMLEESAQGDLEFIIEPTIVGTPDEIVANLANGTLDFAVIPANLSSVIYNNTNGKIKALAINNLGVLYVLENGDTINTVEDLKGATMISPGKGTTPEFSLNYVLNKNGINPETDLTIEYKTEAAEVAQLMISNNANIAMVPEPMVTNILMKNENVRIALSLNDEWNKVSENSKLVTGVLVGRTEFLDDNQELIPVILDSYKSSIEKANADVKATATLTEKYGIIAAAIAENAIPNCNLQYIDKEGLKADLSGYLETLFEINPKSIGGKMPDEGFFYTAGE